MHDNDDDRLTRTGDWVPSSLPITEASLSVQPDQQETRITTLTMVCDGSASMPDTGWGWYRPVRGGSSFEGRAGGEQNSLVRPPRLPSLHIYGGER